MSALWILVRRDWRDRYPTAWAGLGEAIGLALSLSIYWYTAQAFGGSMAERLQGVAPDYFSFVLLGEAVLLVPLSLMTSFLRIARESQADGTLEAMLVLPWSGPEAVLALGLSALPRELARAAMIVLVAVTAFGFSIGFGTALGLIALQLLALPFSISLGMMAAAFFFRFGRGDGAIGFATVVAAILAGAYFPVTVLPEAISSAAKLFSPFTALLELSRQWAAGAGFATNGEAARLAASLAAWTGVGLPFGWLALDRSLATVRERGSLEVIGGFSSEFR